MERTKGELDKWIVPKRGNVYQTLAFLAVLDAYPSCCNFNSANQSKVATKMKVDYGATKFGTVQPQAARTTKQNLLSAESIIDGTLEELRVLDVYDIVLAGVVREED